MSTAEKLDLNKATAITETVLTFPHTLKPPVMTEAVDGKLHYSDIGETTPMVFHYPGMAKEEPGLSSLTVHLLAGNSVIFCPIPVHDAHKPVTLTYDVRKMHLTTGRALRIRANMYFDYQDGTEKTVRTEVVEYPVVP